MKHHEGEPKKKKSERASVILQKLEDNVEVKIGVP